MPWINERKISVGEKNKSDFPLINNRHAELRTESSSDHR